MTGVLVPAVCLHLSLCLCSFYVFFRLSFYESEFPVPSFVGSRDSLEVFDSFLLFHRFSFLRTLLCFDQVLWHEAKDECD